MSEADVIRRGLVDPVWTGLSYAPTDATREEARAALDSLTTRLAEAQETIRNETAGHDEEARTLIARLAELDKDNAEAHDVMLNAIADKQEAEARLAEVTNRMHVLQAQLDDSATRLAGVERERDELDRNLHGTGGVIDSLAEAYERLAEAERERDAIRTERQEAVAHALHVEERNNIAEVEAAELREQLTQAREALERIAELDEAWVVTDNTRGTHLVKLARQALATMSDDG